MRRGSLYGSLFFCSMAFRRFSTLSASICQSRPNFSACKIPALIKARTLWGVTPRRAAAAVTVILSICKFADLPLNFLERVAADDPIVSAALGK